MRLLKGKKKSSRKRKLPLECTAEMPSFKPGDNGTCCSVASACSKCCRDYRLGEEV